MEETSILKSGELQVAAVQMVSGESVADNLAQARGLLEQAAADVRLAVLPENFGFLGATEAAKLAVAEADGDGPMQAFLAEQARRLGLWLVGGTLPLRGETPERVRAACLVYSPEGRRVARYDKMHLFDVEVGEGESYRESASLEPGGEPVVVETGAGRVGLSVCYDLRFPELYRALVARGAELLVVPSAFTATTGAAHWEILVRARAVENLCHVVAPNQGGHHPGGRETYGHSMVVDPWGRLQAQWDTGPGLAQAVVTAASRDALRRRFPVLDHRRINREATVSVAPAGGMHEAGHE